MPLLPSSIICYQPVGGDALRLGRCRAESNGCLPPGGWLSHLQADCLYIRISSGLNARKRVRENFTFFYGVEMEIKLNRLNSNPVLGQQRTGSNKPSCLSDCAKPNSQATIRRAELMASFSSLLQRQNACLSLGHSSITSDLCMCC